MVEAVKSDAAAWQVARRAVARRLSRMAPWVPSRPTRSRSTRAARDQSTGDGQLARRAGALTRRTVLSHGRHRSRPDWRCDGASTTRAACRGCGCRGADRGSDVCDGRAISGVLDDLPGVLRSVPAHGSSALSAGRRRVAHTLAGSGAGHRRPHDGCSLARSRQSDRALGCGDGCVAGVWVPWRATCPGGGLRDLRAVCDRDRADGRANHLVGRSATHVTAAHRRGRLRHALTSHARVARATGRNRPPDPRSGRAGLPGRHARGTSGRRGPAA